MVRGAGSPAPGVRSMAESISSRVPLWAYRLPPNGLTDEFQKIYGALIDPITTVASYEPERTSRGTAALFAGWHEKLRHSEDAMNTLLGYLPGTAHRTWR